MDKDISVTGVISDIGIDTWTEKTYVSVGTDELFDMYEICMKSDVFWISHPKLQV